MIPDQDPPREKLLKQVQTKRKKYFRLKHTRAAAFEERGYENLADNLHRCEEYYRKFYCSACNGYFNAVHNCKLRVCPLCAYHKAKERQKFIKAMLGDMIYPKLVTLTMKRWHGEPQDGIDYLRKNINLLLKRKLFEEAAGGAYQIEVLIKPDGYHIHAHLIVDMPFLFYRKLFAAWRDLLGGYPPQVDIRAARTEGEKNYVTSYVTKDSYKSIKKANIVDWYEATKNRRLFTTFGKWFNVKLEDITDNEKQDHKGMKCPLCGARGYCSPLDTVQFEYDKDISDLIKRNAPDDGCCFSRIYKDSWRPPPDPGLSEPAFL